MFLTLLMPPAHVGTCTEILDLLKSKRNDLTNCYFPVYENCKVVRHVSDWSDLIWLKIHSDRIGLFWLSWLNDSDWAVNVIISGIFWSTWTQLLPSWRFPADVNINVFKAESTSFSWPSSSRWGSSSKCSSSLHTPPMYPRSCFSNCLLLPRMSSLGTSICFHCEAAEWNVLASSSSSCFLFNIVVMWAEKSCS